MKKIIAAVILCLPLAVAELPLPASAYQVNNYSTDAPSGELIAVMQRGRGRRRRVCYRQRVRRNGRWVHIIRCTYRRY